MEGGRWRVRFWTCHLQGDCWISRQLATRLEFRGEAGARATHLGVIELGKEGSEKVPIPSLSFQFTVPFFSHVAINKGPVGW